LQRVLSVVLATALCCASATLRAEDNIPVTEPAGAEVAPSQVTVPSFTEVAVQILAELGSKTSTKGETFPIRLVNAIIVDGREIVPAGTEGVGEVIHAKGNGGMGAAGELILTARYLQVGDRQLPLRSFHVGGTAHDRIGLVDTLAVASAASPLPIGLLGFFIKGNQLTVASGTVATARTAADFTIELPPTPEAAAAEVPAAVPQDQPTGEVAQ